MKYLVLKEWYGSPKAGQIVEIKNINKALGPNVKRLQEEVKKPTQQKEVKKEK